MEALQSLLTSHVLQADRQARTLASQSEELLQMLFSPNPVGNSKDEAVKPPDPAATLDLITRLSRLYNVYAGELRKSISLMDHLDRPRSPSLKVVAAGEQINVAGAQQVNNGRHG